MTLEKLTLKDFQCHKTLDIDLDHPVVTLVGESDNGKSAVLRAIRWLATNRPSGTSFIRRAGGKEGRTAVVTLQVDGHAAQRTRGPAANELCLDGRAYRAMGTGTPPELDLLLNLGPENVQRQHDGPFWFGLSPGEVSRQLNSIINLGLIDQTLANLASRLRKAKAEQEVSEERLKQARERRAGLAWVKEAWADWEGVEAGERALGETLARTARLAEIVERVREAAEAKISLYNASQAGLRAVTTGELALNVAAQAGRLAALLGSIRAANSRARQLKKEAALAHADLQRRLGGRCPFCGGDLPA